MFQNVHVQRQFVEDRNLQIRREVGSSRLWHDSGRRRRLVRPGPSR